MGVSRKYRADFFTRSAYLSSDFGESFARKYFGEEVLKDLPRYVRGKRKGLLKGKVAWTRCTRGGWVGHWGGAHEECGGHVEHRVNQIIEVTLLKTEWREPDVIIKKWEK
jgi:hypothetical protein